MSSDQASSDEESIFPFDTDLLVMLFFVVVFCWGVYLALQIPTWDRQPDRIYPRLLVSALLLLTAVELVKIQFPSLVGRIMPSKKGSDEAAQLRKDISGGAADRGRPRRERQKYELILSGWVTALPILIYLFGFVYVLPPYVFALTYYMERSLKKAILTTSVFVVFGYVIFVRLLNVPFWLGVVFGGRIG